MTLKEGVISEILYRKETGEVADRTIIPVYMAQPNIKAIDIGELNTKDRLWLQDCIKEYQEYLAAKRATILSLENWVEHTKNQRMEVKWRTYKPSGITEK
jgi:hypothetical protein